MKVKKRIKQLPKASFGRAVGGDTASAVGGQIGSALSSAGSLATMTGVGAPVGMGLQAAGGLIGPIMSFFSSIGEIFKKAPDPLKKVKWEQTNQDGNYSFGNPQAKYGMPLFDNGGKIEPIYVSDKNDPRLKSYQDSLTLYKQSNQERVNNLLKQGFAYDTDKNKIQNNIFTAKDKKTWQKSIGVNEKKGLQKIVQSGNDGIKDNYVGGNKDIKKQNELVHGKIAPVAIAPLYDKWWRNNKYLYDSPYGVIGGSEVFKNEKNFRVNPNYGKPNAKDKAGEVIRNFFEVPIYKKPAQPVVYRKKETSVPVPKSTPVKQTTKSNKVEPIYVTDPKDKRLQAYNDSLNLYNNHSFSTKNLKDIRSFTNTDVLVNMSIAGKDFINKNKIKPIKIGTLDDRDKPIYKKPVQPVIYKKPEVSVPVPKFKTTIPQEQNTQSMQELLGKVQYNNEPENSNTKETPNKGSFPQGTWISPSPYGGMHKYDAKGRQLYKNGGFLDKVDAVLSAPQRAATYAVEAGLHATGLRKEPAKYEDPSDAIGIDGEKHPWLKLGTDVVLDPTNLLGVGLASKAGKLAKGYKVLKSTDNVIGDLDKGVKLIARIDKAAKASNDAAKLAKTVEKTASGLNKINHTLPNLLLETKFHKAINLGAKDAKGAVAIINDLINQYPDKAEEIKQAYTSQVKNNTSQQSPSTIKSTTKQTSIINKKSINTKPSFENFYKTVNPDYNDTTTYNLREAYNNLPYNELKKWQQNPEINHLPDTYKLPTHPTFSNESKYYKEGMPAGKWEGENYIPINRNTKESISPERLNFMKQPSTGEYTVYDNGKIIGTSKDKTINTLKREYALGGDPRAQSNIEAEEGETMKHVSGKVETIGGKKHPQGGTPLQIQPSHEYIFSDSLGRDKNGNITLNEKDVVRSFADDSRNIERRYKGKENDKIAADSKKFELDNLKQVAEQARVAKEEIEMGKQMKKYKAKYGADLKKFVNSGYVPFTNFPGQYDDEQVNSNSVLALQQKLLQYNLDALPKFGADGFYGNETKQGFLNNPGVYQEKPENYRTIYPSTSGGKSINPFIGPPKPGGTRDNSRLNLGNHVDEFVGEPWNSSLVKGLESLEPKQRTDFFKDMTIGDKLGLAGMIPGSLYNIGMGLSKAEKEGFHKNPYMNRAMGIMANRKFTEQPFINQALLANNALTQDINNNSTSVGVRNSNLLKVHQNYMNQLADITGNAQQLNNAYRAEEAQTMTGFGETLRQEGVRQADINAKNQATKQNFLAKGVSQIGQGISTVGQGSNQVLTNQILAKALSEISPDFDIKDLDKVYTDKDGFIVYKGNKFTYAPDRKTLIPVSGNTALTADEKKSQYKPLEGPNLANFAKTITRTK